MCTCHAEMDAKLEPLNGKLATGFTVRQSDGGISTMDLVLLMQVEKIVPRGKRPPHVIPTFCPFCGKRLISKPVSTE